MGHVTFPMATPFPVYKRAPCVAPPLPIHCVGVTGESLGFGIEGCGFAGSGCEVWGLAEVVGLSGCRVSGFEFRV